MVSVSGSKDRYIYCPTLAPRTSLNSLCFSCLPAKEGSGKVICRTCIYFISIFQDLNH